MPADVNRKKNYDQAYRGRVGYIRCLLQAATEKQNGCTEGIHPKAYKESEEK